ncbi:MAG TPA: asparagine synthase (glutamine-hydrolyzing) [Candidatus Cybelea sp.]|nr:asparagine synthase (glutamine-hydrolyzing) [Candidatus Cybelea sp.]
MCGINGIVWHDGAIPGAADLVEAMNGRLRHRGPDGNGVWSGDHAAFGQTRLSIIDLSDRGRQPMQNADGSLILVCNGEIYNHRELRRDMELDGYAFHSDTDVEVILPLYERFGERCVDKLVGMFAFAIWDTRRRRLFMARDRIGEKPLYYVADRGRLAFASEIKALLTLPWLDRAVREEAIPSLMVYQTLPAPLTIFRAVDALPPSTTLAWDQSGMRIERYWHIDFSRRRAWRKNDAIDAYDALMAQSVEGCLIADVPVGVLLSGGVDSSTIAVLAAERHAGIRSFCIGHDAPGAPDPEFPRAQAVAERIGTRHRNIQFDFPTLAELPRILSGYDQPMWCMVALYVDRLAELIRREVKVALSGNGADEVFSGYAAYARLPVLDVLHRVARPLPEWIANVAPDSMGQRLRRVLAAAGLPLAARRGAVLSLLADDMLQKLCTADFAGRWRGSDPGRFVVDAVSPSNPQTLADAVTYGDLMVYHQHGHATIADTSSMAHGLELRSPFLDHRIVEFAASLPRHLILPLTPRPSQAKALLKESLAAKLPRKLVYAPKVGFGYGIPMDDLVRGAWAGPVRDLLMGGRYLELGIFSREGAAFAMSHSYQATCILLCFAIWAEMYLFGSDASALAARFAGEVPEQAAARGVA